MWPLSVHISSASTSPLTERMLVAQLGYVPGRNTPAYYAAIYLLTSNEVVYWRTANCFCNGGLDFQYVFFRGITTYNDAL